jgi:hypothetical protein
MQTLLKDKDTSPDFCWDRKLTAGAIKAQLAAADGPEWVRIASWILREAAFADVWTFLKPTEVSDRLDELTPFLGRRKDFWKYIIGAWHELGKI